MLRITLEAYSLGTLKTIRGFLLFGMWCTCHSVLLYQFAPFFVAYQPPRGGGLLIGKERKRLIPFFSLLCFGYARHWATPRQRPNEFGFCSRLAPMVSARCFAGVPRCVSSHNQFHKRGCGSAETKQLGSALTLHSFSQEVVIVITPAADV